MCLYVCARADEVARKSRNDKSRLIFKGRILCCGTETGEQFLLFGIEIDASNMEVLDLE